eukprot:jgi/Picre1/30934/NNA_006293.t1
MASSQQQQQYGSFGQYQQQQNVEWYSSGTPGAAMGNMSSGGMYGPNLHPQAAPYNPAQYAYSGGGLGESMGHLMRMHLFWKNWASMSQQYFIGSSLS